MIGTANSALYEYNSENKLVKATVQNGSLVIEESYTYDYQGNRTSKTTHKSNGEFEYTKYLNDNSSLTNVLAEIDENGTAKCVYTIGADLVSQERDGKVSVYLYDGHGSVVGLANEGGVVTDTYSYDAFGNLLKSKGSTENCYRYCGEQFDESTGFIICVRDIWILLRVGLFRRIAMRVRLMILLVCINISMLTVILLCILTRVGILQKKHWPEYVQSG